MSQKIAFRRTVLERPHLEIGFATDKGTERDHNEDAVLCEPPGSQYVEARGILCAVADGMGGHNAGEVASRVAVDTVRDVYYRSAETDPAVALRSAIEAANRVVLTQAGADPSRQGMGSTLTAVVIHGWSLTIGHVGDSRAYLVRNGALHQLTTDDSWVEDQRAAGLLTAEQARSHPQRNILTQALGHVTEPRVQITRRSLNRGDSLVLCSDGLHGAVAEDEIARVIGAEHSLEAATSLIRMANMAGGDDNVSVVVVQVEPSGQSSGLSAFRELRLPTAFPIFAALAVLLFLVVGLLLQQALGRQSMSESEPSGGRAPQTPPVEVPARIAPGPSSPQALDQACLTLPGSGSARADPAIGAALHGEPRRGPNPALVPSGTQLEVLCMLRSGQEVDGRSVWYKVRAPLVSGEGFIHCTAITLDGRRDACDAD